ncbi:hypothetical protein NZD85_09865 [Empedobacter stercoris]|uniref:hypothetical protein n=1 Tax=Empedobacter stercoris TaxID=1628248 RepID=UPI0021B064FC|nr:hypothetical protein [Empedobacter stercoris]UWX66200.1 hypothetical protein NZD85_09865 [Empedobacter stercoris]
MIKYLIILLATYVIYYTVNIVYDLFLKKEKTENPDDKEEYSLGDIVTNDIKTVNIDDVEDLKTPASFQQVNIQSNDDNLRPNLEELRERFENENEIDSSANLNKESESKAKSTKDKNNWKELMRLSETMVQVVKNYDGQKVYHSTI